MEHPITSPLGADRPLAGLRVVELASVLAGPLAGTFFAELGAEVVKVEHPEGGDVTRQWRGPGEPESGPSAYYVAANGPKGLRRLDLSSDADRTALDTLLGTADILLQNFRPASLARLGLDPESSAVRFPRLIHVHLQGFLGEPGRPGYDMVVQAETGLMGLNAGPDGVPFRMPVAMMDVLAAHQMRSAALLALWERERDGKGSYMEVWLDAAGMGALVNRATEYLVNQAEPCALGPLHPQIAPYGETFSCACGGRVVLSIGNDTQFGGLCALLGHPEWTEDPRFSSNPARVLNRSALAANLEAVLSTWDRDHLMKGATLAGVPLGRVNRVSEALNQPTGRAMTREFSSEGKMVRHVRQVAFRIHRFGSRTR